ncbi:hypothetical protein FSP39_009102 [Pinctada imbricata]|uniref:Spaetzle domain-containing protein n=1 Tax=Pinctada imbricata TaxID=66713 RepID=A0AA88Y9W9_PINIB|nr:hypothetical protein FSP39_009102 [Pinctada imbricata]
MSRSSYLLAVSALMTVFLLYSVTEVKSSHQKWWLLGCQCFPWQKRLSRLEHSRRTFRDLVLNMYRGLFVTRRGLRHLPVIKPEGERSHGHNQRTYVGRTVPQMDAKQKSCCNTDYAYEVVNSTVVQNRKLRVVHFDRAFQFAPTGRCPDKASCGFGSCLQMYRHHWMLVWDESMPVFPPVRFVPVELPSHCECVNLGT